eukprot:Awhi_evm1s13789
MCYSGYCGSDGECEFSSKQLLIVLVAAMALGVLFLAASAPTYDYICYEYTAPSVLLCAILTKL